MYHPLTPLPTRVIADSNVLLDATFVRNGLARRAMDVLGQLGQTIIVDEMIEREALVILDRLQRDLCLTFNPKEFFDDNIRRLRALHVPPADPNLGMGVNR